MGYGCMNRILVTAHNAFEVCKWRQAYIFRPDVRLLAFEGPCCMELVQMRFYQRDVLVNISLRICNPSYLYFNKFKTIVLPALCKVVVFDGSFPASVWRHTAYRDPWRT